MTVTINPSVLSGRVNAPPSKSMAHRLLICAGLAEGESYIKNVAYSEDILATLDCLQTMGAEVVRGTDYVKILGASPLKSKAAEYFCRESGSTLRFFVPLAMLSGDECSFTGSERLMERPMTVYENIARQKGLYYENTYGVLWIRGKLTSGIYKVAADISSQFISGLLFALPLCDGDSEIHLKGKVESRSYIDMTLEAMGTFGVVASWKDDNILYIRGGQSYKSRELTVEGDYSNAAFLNAFNFVGGNVSVEGLRKDTLQGDAVYGKYFSLLSEGKAELDVSNCPDLAPILMCLAAELNGGVLKGTARLRIKESDRGAVMKEELTKLGADIEIYENEIIINKAQLKATNEPLLSHNDHRVVMSLAVLCSKYGGKISGCEAVRKSYPDFFDCVRELGLEAQINDDK